MNLTLWKPHRNQIPIVRDKHRYKVIVCGRRFGKTTLAIYELLKFALAMTGGNYWYISPTYRQSKMIAWRMLLNAYHLLPKELQRNKNEAELWVEIGNNSRIELKGADNEDSLRGVGLNGIIIDEVASIDKFKTIWEEVLRPALTDKKGWSMFIGTPKGYNHFYELWKKGQENLDIDWKSWQFTSFDNPYLDKNEITKAKQELTEDAFAQEYLADFRKHTGLIYKEFDRKIHVVAPFEIPSWWQVYRTMDFGAVNPTVCLWVAIDPNDDVYVFDEYYNTGQATSFHAGVILGKTKHNVILTYGDPSGEQEMLDYSTFGLNISPANKFIPSDEKSWVVYGIKKVTNLLRVNGQAHKPRLFFFSNCINTIREFELYRWLEQKDTTNSREVPVKEHDHCPDAVRYFVVSYSPQNYKQYEPPLEVQYNEITGY